MEKRTQTFDEKLTLLLEEAKKKKNVLEYQEISDFFSRARSWIRTSWTGYTIFWTTIM